eukprot:scaffold87471_cov28-Tisochrysis_lutea.AAC.4
MKWSRYLLIPVSSRASRGGGEIVHLKPALLLAFNEAHLEPQLRLGIDTNVRHISHLLGSTRNTVGVLRKHAAEEKFGGDSLLRGSRQMLCINSFHPHRLSCRVRLSTNFELCTALRDAQHDAHRLGASAFNGDKISGPERGVCRRRSWLGCAALQRRLKVCVGVGLPLEVACLEREAAASVGAHAPALKLGVPAYDRRP